MKRTKLSLVALTAITVALLLSAFNSIVPIAASDIPASLGKQPANQAQTPLYTSCTEDKPTAVLTPAAPATAAATAQAAAATTGPEDFVFLRIVGKESEACYQATETFAAGNF